MAKGKKQYVSMRGVSIDMEAMLTANESLPALNGGTDVRMNARGDLLGNNGSVDITREQIVRDYYKNNPQGVRQVSLNAPLPDTFETPSEAVARITGNEPEELDKTDNVVIGKKARKLIHKED